MSDEEMQAVMFGLACGFCVAMAIRVIVKDWIDK